MKGLDIGKLIFPYIFLYGTIGIAVGLPDAQADFINTKLPLIYGLVGWSILLGILGAVAATRKVKHLMPDRLLRGYNVCSAFIFLVFLWEVLSNKITLLDPFVFVAPARVFEAFTIQYPVLIRSVLSSMDLLLWGFFTGIIAGIILALIVGYFKPIFNVGYPLAKVIAPIPTPVYIPFLIVALPAVRTAAVVIIFLGAFWPTFATTCFAAYAFDRKYLEAARMLGAKSHWNLIFRVIYPGVKPEIYSGVFIGLILSFILLIVAEMIGASSGLGFYLLTQRLLSHYTEVIVGILTASLVVVLWATVFDFVEKRSLKWQAIE